MDAETTEVWLDPAPPAPEARRALAEWARARGVRLVAPIKTSAPATVVDLALADRVEADLEKARDALAEGDLEGAERALTRAEALVIDHPELPHAAFLLAEVERASAVRWLRQKPADEARARAAWRRAEVLDGGRAPGVGEPPADSRPAGTDRFTLVPERDATLVLDGMNVPSGEIARLPGRHHVASVRRGAVVWSGWITIASGETVKVPVPAGAPCSEDDLGSATLDKGAVRAAGVRCPRWIAATSFAGGVRVATCERDRCAAALEWRTWRSIGPTYAPHMDKARFRWPAWATWTLVGVGAAAAATTALVASGVFEARPTETHFLNGGVQIEAHPWR